MASPAPPPPGQAPGPANEWTQHFADGRPFWVSSVTKQSVWEKPDALKTPAELEMDTTPYKEYVTKGRPYWVHQDGTTTWDRPKVIQDILDKHARASAPPPGPPGMPSPLPPAPGGFAGSPSGAPGSSTPLNAQTGAIVAPGGFGAGGPSAPASSSLPPNIPMRNGVPYFQTQAEAEQAFMSMLKTVGVTAEWTWERVMRETVTEPLYKALKTLSERKAAFEKYVVESKREEQEERERSLERCRKDWFKAMDKLGGGPTMETGVKTWWSWDRGRRELEAKFPETFKGPRNDKERETLFLEYIDALRKKEEAHKREVREKNMHKLSDILQSLELDLAGAVRWQDARSTITRTSEWHRDPELQKVDPIDILAVFEEEVRKAEKEASELRHRTTDEKRRKARKAREDFKSLLNQLRETNHVTTGTTWQSIYPVIASDPRYLNLLGLPGSSPLDLFWDVVDELDMKAEDDQRLIENVLEQRKTIIGEHTTFDEFEEAVKADERVDKLEKATRRYIFERLHARAIRHAKEEKRRAEKKLRLQIDDLRYALKKLDPPIDLDATYDDVVPRIKDAPEFTALEHDDASRRTAFEKFIRRQKDKLKEQERDSIRHRTRDGDSGRHRSSRDDGEGTRGSSEAPDERRRDSKRSASREAPLDDVPKRKVPRTGSSKRDVDGDAAMRDDEEPEEGEIE